eukprot:ctg_126.g59
MMQCGFVVAPSGDWKARAPRAGCGVMSRTLRMQLARAPPPSLTRRALFQHLGTVLLAALSTSYAPPVRAEEELPALTTLPRGVRGKLQPYTDLAKGYHMLHYPTARIHHRGERAGQVGRQVGDRSGQTGGGGAEAGGQAQRQTGGGEYEGGRRHHVLHFRVHPRARPPDDPADRLPQQAVQCECQHQREAVAAAGTVVARLAGQLRAASVRRIRGERGQSAKVPSRQSAARDQQTSGPCECAPPDRQTLSAHPRTPCRCRRRCPGRSPQSGTCRRGTAARPRRHRPADRTLPI